MFKDFLGQKGDVRFFRKGRKIYAKIENVEAVAICHKTDFFNEYFGMDLAEARAELAFWENRKSRLLARGGENV